MLLSIQYLILSCCIQAAAQHDSLKVRGIEIGDSGNKDSLFKAYYNKSYALIIGASEYKNGWTSLPGAARDAQNIQQTLKEHGFETALIMNPAKPSKLEQIFDAFLQLTTGDKDNRLIIYYAGHGYKDINGAYIVTTEGRRDIQNSNVQATTAQEENCYFDLTRLFKLVNEHPVPKHVLLVLDGCYLGKTSDNLATNQGMPPMIREYITTPGRHLLTSSTRDQEVPDESIFCEYFLKGINGEADLFPDGYVILSELKIYLQNQVGNKSGGKEVIFMGQILDSNERKKRDKAYGEMIFYKPAKN